MKADTMNEKTIELSEGAEILIARGLDQELAVLLDDYCMARIETALWNVAKHQGPNGIRMVRPREEAIVAAIIASRSRAASEPGEVARLAEDCKEQAKKCALELRAMGYMPGVTEKLEWGRAFGRYEMAIDRLASMASSPASEAQAGWVMVPREPTPEMQHAAEMAYRAWCDAEVPYSEFKHSDSYRAMLASAPLPASFPVAAEGQKAVERVCSTCHHAALSENQGPCSGCGYAAPFDRWEPVATPTASMADAAEAVAVVLNRVSDGKTHKGASLHQNGLDLPVGTLLYATPGPRGENAGGVVEAKPFGWYGESRFDNDFTTNEDTSRRWHANGYRLTPLYTHPSPAPDRGLRIAEKGGDRG